MKHEELDEMVSKSLAELLKNPETQKLLADSADADKLLKALAKTSEFQALLAAVRGMSDRLSEMGMSIGSIVDTLKSHQEAIKNLTKISEAMTNRAKASALDVTLKPITHEKSSKPN